jgi:hypothetical protein
MTEIADMRRTLAYAAFLLALIAACTLTPRPSSADPTKRETQATEEVSFNRDIRPILSNRCFKCHGPDLKKGKLNLRERESAVAHAITPGKATESVVIDRLTTDKLDKRMPFKADPLTAEQIAKIKAWIDQGAKYEEHWAYVRPVHHPAPAVKNQAWVRNPIDAFVLARLEKEGLSPSAEADRATLIRRVSLDLTGLPPTPEEVDAFLNDTSPDAYEKVVDRLLASPHYGEHQARPWLDMARYADTNGYEKDDRRTIWPYRDWVINAYNRDLPFDQFTIEQVAGDLLPNATRDQQVATGFHRNTMINTEGGTDDEEFRVAAIVDRVNTTAAVWLGTTLNCCQCHNHKFDPFSQKEFYQLFAFFNGTADPGRDTAPHLPLPTPEQAARLAKLAAEIADLQKALDTPTPELTAAQEKWEREQSGATATWTVLDAGSMESKEGVTLTKQADGSILASGKEPETDTYTIQATMDLTGITAFRLEALPDPSLGAMGPGRAGHGNFVLTGIKIAQAAKDKPEEAKAIALQNASADFAQNDFPASAALDGNPKTGWAIAPQFGKAHIAIFEVKCDDAGLKGGTVITVTMEQDYGGKHTIGKFRLSATNAARPVRVVKLPEAVTKALAVPADKRTDAHKSEIVKYYRSTAPELKATRDKIAALKKQEAADAPPTTLVMKELPKLRETHVMIRGNFRNTGEKVEPGVPAKLNPLPEGQALNRLTLAKWLVDPANPLVPRVLMNRIWARYFGRGFVETSEDYGAQGEPPTNPELLDWLATELIGRKWSLKAMHRLIVTSATYRQSSKAPRELFERDPYNQLLARGPRFRLDAEAVRDNALAISGLLTEKLGGPSVFPYQPEGVWFNPYSSDKWVVSTGGDQYRRGLYTFWRRTAPYAAFMAFDAPSREVCTERRPRTNTPLQALATLNDKAFVECSAALARRIMTEARGGDRERAIHGFRLCVARAPTDKEMQYLLELYAESLEKYRKDPKAAAVLALSGLPAPPKDLSTAELAAWTVVANVLLNLDETITKG